MSRNLYFAAGFFFGSCYGSVMTAILMGRL